MPRRKSIKDTLKLMEKTENIRNIGFVGHIDHGKTTLSDSLLSEAGLLSPDLAGEARALDFLEEEQERGITMKSANISLYYEKTYKKPEPFIINLVDTPGHLDFSGKVTRALRLVDGAVVVVDAVEEIISQSETVVKQALQEGVKPVLFINKVDRLIRELKLTDEEIRKKYIRIIKDFNTLVERFAEPQFKEKWKVSPEQGNVVFGSALHKWGFTVEIMEKSEIKFKEIRKRYKKETYTKESYSDLQLHFPISEAILEMVVDHLPNPKEAQEYRIQKIWDGELDSDVGKAMRECDPKGPMIICLSKVQVEKHGLVATGRIFSGSCINRADVFLMRENNISTIQRIAIFMGQRREQVNEIPVGNIVAIEGLKEIKSGETVIDEKVLGNMVPFENVKYVSTPVVTVSIEPEYLRDLEQMKSIIENLLIEDPNLEFEINEENGEFLLSGMGPLHLEIAANDIEKRGVDVSMSQPRAVFKESCRNESSLIEVETPNKKGRLSLRLERLDKKSVAFFQCKDYSTFKPRSKLEDVLLENTGLTADEISQFWFADEDNNALLFPDRENLSGFYQNMIPELIFKIHLNGPLSGEKITEVKIIVEEYKFDEISEEEAFTELSALFYNAVKQGLKAAQSVLLEPIYRTVIQLPPDYTKKALSLVPKYSGKIIEINQENEYQAVIEIYLPVRNSVDFAEDIRSITSGKAFWQNRFDSYMEVPAHEADRIISDLRFLKGLSW